MTPDELHELLQTLKEKNSFDVNIAETKKTIRNELVAYRSDSPNPPMLPYALITDPDQCKDIVFYSFLNNPSKPAIAEHEYKRLKLSWESLRKHNSDIEVRFCLDGCTEHEYHIWLTLCEDNNVSMYPFHESFSNELLLFPSWMTHKVDVNEKATTDRISISFNTFVRGNMGNERAKTELIL